MRTMMPNLLALVLVTSCAGSFAYASFDEIDDLDIADSAAIRAVVQDHTSVEIPLDELEFEAPSDNDTHQQKCHRCVHKVSKKIIEHRMHKLEKLCKHVSLPSQSVASQHPHPHPQPRPPCHLMRICRLLRRRPQIALGLVIQRVRPVALGFMFCKGKGECKHTDDNATMAGLSEEHVAGEILLKDLDRTDWDDLLAEVDLAPPPLEEQVPEPPMAEGDQQCFHQHPHPHHHPDHHDHHQHRCMRRTARAVMLHAMTRVFEKCMDAEGRTESKCAWMLAHYKTTFGMLLGQVEPWKFALGFCAPRDHGHHAQHWRHDRGHEGHHEHHQQHGDDDWSHDSERATAVTFVDDGAATANDGWAIV